MILLRCSVDLNRLIKIVRLRRKGNGISGLVPSSLHVPFSTQHPIDFFHGESPKFSIPILLPHSFFPPWTSSPPGDLPTDPGFIPCRGEKWQRSDRSLRVSFCLEVFLPLRVEIGDGAAHYAQNDGSGVWGACELHRRDRVLPAGPGGSPVAADGVQSDGYRRDRGWEDAELRVFFSSNHKAGRQRGAVQIRYEKHFSSRNWSNSNVLPT